MQRYPMSEETSHLFYVIYTIPRDTVVAAWCAYSFVYASQETEWTTVGWRL